MLKTIEGDVLKIAGFLLVLGLAIGLWLGLWMGFNPRTHSQVTRDLNSTKAFYVRIQNEISTTTHKWESQIKAKEKTTTPPKTTSQPTATASRWISNAFASLWKFLQRTWLGVAASLHPK